MKAHGRELAPRWCTPATKDDVFPSAGVPGEFPPFHAMPPQAGMPRLETNHSYHVKSSPIVLETARCNNDVTPLLRISNALLDLLRQENDSESGDDEKQPVFGYSQEEFLFDTLHHIPSVPPHVFRRVLSEHTSN